MSSLLLSSTRSVSIRLQHAHLRAAMRCVSSNAAAARSVESSADVAAATAAPASIPRLRIGSSANRVSFIEPKVKKGQESAIAAAAAASQTYSLETAVGLVRACAHASFDETVSLSLRLNLDPRKPNQSVRGAATLPHGTGKTMRVAVFAKGEKAQDALAAGADIVGDKELVDQITAGKIDFERCIATPDMMAFVGRVARILGPRGLMPNPKVGTVTTDVAAAVKAAKQGSVEFKTDKSGVIHAAMGKVSFSRKSLKENIEAFVEKIIEMKPSGAPKGIYILSSHIASSHGPGVPLDTRMAPFKSALQISSADSERSGTAALGAYGRMHSLGGFNVVRYDLGSHPSEELIASSKGKWPLVKEQIKKSRKEKDGWKDVLQKIHNINTSPALQNRTKTTSAANAANANTASTPKGTKPVTPVPSTAGKETTSKQAKQ
jgi:large subunit ribosomal protein L1